MYHIVAQGFTTLVSKASALIWVLQLELPNDNQNEKERSETFKRYCRQVISITSDQGTEFGFGTLPELQTEKLVTDTASLLQSKPVQTQCLSLADDVSAVTTIALPEEAIDAHQQANQRREQQVQPIEQQVQPIEQQVQPIEQQVQPFQQQQQRSLFPNAFHVPGLKHISDNLLESVLSSMSMWDALLTQLKALEKLLSRVQYRERLAAVCVPESEIAARSAIESFAAKLGGLRWEVIVEFSVNLLEIEEHLCRFWNMELFLRGAAGHGKWTLSADFQEADAAIKSDVFWARTSLVSGLAFEAEYVGRWAGGCSCHEPLLSHKGNQKPESDLSCPHKGCRAPELAAGTGLHQQLKLMARQQSTLPAQFCRMGRDTAAANELHSDWVTARSRLFGYLAESLLDHVRSLFVNTQEGTRTPTRIYKSVSNN